MPGEIGSGQPLPAGSKHVLDEHPPIAIPRTSGPLAQTNGLRPWIDQSRLIGVAVTVGIVLRLVQYFGDRSLWLDEAFLSESFVRHSATQLAHDPLDYWQMAPLGFVELERLSVTMFGPSELALRFWPLLAGLAALVLFARLAKFLVPEVAVGAVALFAVAPPLVYYSAEVKPYAFDVFMAVVLVLAAIVLVADHPSRTRWGALALGGLIAPWLSFTAVFGLAATAAVAVVHGWHERRDDRWRLLTLGAAWGVSAGAAILDVRRRTDSSLIAGMH